MARYLISRFSAMGDVAMLLPVLYAVARANPQHRFTLLTQPFLTTLMLNTPDNLEAMAIDIKREERSVWGLLRYAERLRAERFDYFVDLHDVLRTKVLRLCVGLLSPTRRVVLVKPRRARRRLLSRHQRDLSPLPSMHSLYAETLRRAGLVVPESIEPIRIDGDSILHHRAVAPYFPEGVATRVCLGVAPFASTEAKMYDLAQMEQVVAHLCLDGRYRIYLFGSRDDAPRLEGWAERYGAVNLAGRLGLYDELYAISLLDGMLSMDSANAHLAAMVATPVISLWCCTHPSAGFMALGQSVESCIQPTDMPCRPCSVFGQVRSCELGDMPCRRAVSVSEVLGRLERFLDSVPRQGQ